MEILNVHIPIRILRTYIWIMTGFPFYFKDTSQLHWAWLLKVTVTWTGNDVKESTCHLFQRTASAFGWWKSGTIWGTYFRKKLRKRGIPNVEVFTFIVPLETATRVLRMACNLLLAVRTTTSSLLIQVLLQTPYRWQADNEHYLPSSERLQTQIFCLRCTSD